MTMKFLLRSIVRKAIFNYADILPFIFSNKSMILMMFNPF